MAYTDENGKVSRFSPMQKKLFMGIVAFTILTVFASIYAGSASQNTPGSGRVEAQSGAGDTGNPPDSQDEKYNQEVRKRNDTEEIEAFNNGGSHIPTPTNGLGQLPQENPNDFLGKDNAGIGVASQPVTTEVTPPQMPASEPQLKYAVTETIRYVPVAKEEAYNYRKDASLVSYLNSTEKPRAFSFNDSGMQARKAREEAAAQAQAQQVANQGGTNESGTETATATNGMVTLHKVGETTPLELMGSLDSSRPSVVRARVLSGDLKDAIVTGSFQQQGKTLSVTFNRINLKGVPQSLPINAVAIDYDSASTAMATSVNTYLPERLLTGFISTAAKSIADLWRNNNVTSTSSSNFNNQSSSSWTTTQTVPKSNRQIFKEAGAEALGTATSEIEKLVPQQPRVKVDVSKLAIGLYFTEDFAVSAQVKRQMDEAQ